MKAFINFSIIIYAMAGVVLLIAPQEMLPDFYRQDVMVSLAFVSALLILLPRLIFRRLVKNKEKAVVKLQFMIAVILLINGAGGLGLYKLYLIGLPYDKLAHFLSSFLATLWGAQFLFAISGKSKKAITALASLTVMAGGILWEFLEALSDHFWETTLVGGGDSLFALDTTNDVLMNLLGITLAFILLRKSGYRRLVLQ